MKKIKEKIVDKSLTKFREKNRTHKMLDYKLWNKILWTNFEEKFMYKFRGQKRKIRQKVKTKTQEQTLQQNIWK